MRKSFILSPYIFPRQKCVDGPKVEQYEKAYASVTGSKYALAFMKGRLAFYAAIKTIGIKDGDEVIMPGYTCMVIPSAVRHLGAKSVYVDIEPKYCTLDPDKLEAAITPRTKAIMIQHTYGWPSVGIERVVEIAKKHEIFILEDCCHALGTRYKNKHVGNFGIAGFFSSQWSKPFTTGLGGMMVCNDKNFYERVKQTRESEALKPTAKVAAQLARQGIVFDLLVYPETMAIARNIYRWLSKKSIVMGSTCETEYTRISEDYFQRISEVQAASGLYELRQWPKNLEHSRDICRFYIDAFNEAGWNITNWPKDCDVTLLRFPLRVINKNEVLSIADKRFVELGDWFIRPLHSHLAPQEAYDYITGMCPEAEKAAREIINLPVHRRVSHNHAKRVIRLLLDKAKQIKSQNHSSDNCD